MSVRPETAGLVRLPQKTGRVPVVAISYTEHEEEVFDYLRALIAMGEKSERGLTLTEEVRCSAVSLEACTAGAVKALDWLTALAHCRTPCVSAMGIPLGGRVGVYGQSEGER